MNFFAKNLFALAIAGSILSCGTSKKTSTTVKVDTTPTKVINLDTLVAKPEAPKPIIYRASETRTNDLIHTKLEVRFNMEKAQLMGKATITVKPYFYPVNTIELDARGMDINEVSILNNDNTKKKLEFDYDKKKLKIKLDKEYTRNETYKIFIDYVSKPNELEAGGSDAISSDKGLYFINPDGKEKNKPQQIWTQGETEANSAWFPTFDKPNERMTDEIYITVDKKFSTLSNGLLSSSTQNADGTRTDYWKMDLPHAPYLIMMAIGEYSIVKDKWKRPDGKDMEVNYYVEKEYEPYAKQIFGNTPEMIDFYSKKLGFPYAWQKYSQVVARDYVSGAMENTSATLHGEFVQQTDREMLDGNGAEDVISHELFHQWFGDLVTCESWSNLPLNESFATYGEYLWNEYKYGRDKADEGLRGDMRGYMSSANNKDKHLIRFEYEDKEDMFDGVSYQKGGRILHMLRKYIGDDAFFESLKYYLETNKFTSVEAHNLRLAFEKTTGQDLNWFFNQWFYSNGHPDLDINYSYDDATKKAKITVKQKQDFAKMPMFKIPVLIDIYVGGTKQTQKVTIEKATEEFTFDVPSKPDLINFDAEKMLLCTKKENKTIEEYIFQYNNAPLYLDRQEALDFLAKKKSSATAKEVLMKALNDKYDGLRNFAISKLEGSDEALKAKLISIAQSDPKTTVRSTAIDALSKNFKGDDLMPIYKNGLNEKSYAIIGSSLEAIAKVNKEEGLNSAMKFENDEILSDAVANIYADYASDDKNSYFVKMYEEAAGWKKIGFANAYGRFLKRCKDETINSGVLMLEAVAKDENEFIKYYGETALKNLVKMYEERIASTQQDLDKLKSSNGSATEISSSETALNKAKEQKDKIQKIVDGLK